MNMQKIIPNIWLHTNDGKLSEAVEYYENIFAKNFIRGQIVPLGQTPSGNAEMCNVHIFEQKFTFMSTQKEHMPPNDSVSFIINCDGQNEIDAFWNYFTKDGKESQCGWCIDKYGIRWQILPKNLAELMSKPNAWKVMMGQKKIVIAEYL